MISICIPIYNNDITKLITDLHFQCEALDCKYEILLIDDASQLDYQIINRDLSKLSNVYYEELSLNISRSAIRNLFPLKASYPYLIYIDNDAEVCTTDYITRYIRLRTAGIICYGGTEYLNYPSHPYYLRWKFGVEREAIPIDKRQQDPDRYFSTFNFMIDKRILLLHPFNEDIHEYGYEDVVFHAEVIKEGYHITQTDNPLVHKGLMSNDDFLKRTNIAIENLNSLEKNKELQIDLSNTVKLLHTQKKIEKYKLTYITSILFRLMKKYFIKNLLGKKPSLFIFDLYKLGYLCTVNISSK